MILLGVRTDNPTAELYLVCEGEVLKKEIWQAHRELSATIHTKIETLLEQAHIGIKDIGGVICFAGGGSFTGLRIGVSVANALAASLQVPVVATTGTSWLEDGAEQIRNGVVRVGVYVEPVYDRPAATTPPKK